MLTRSLRTARLALLGLFAVTALSGCFENDFLTAYTGPTVVEFDQVAGRYTRSVNEGTGPIELRVNLIGPQQSSALTINVNVVDGSTAVQGTHFTFPNGPQLTIPANSSTGTLAINIPDGTLSAGQRGVLNLELAGTPDGTIKGAANFKDFALTIIGR